MIGRHYVVLEQQIFHFEIPWHRRLRRDKCTVMYTNWKLWWDGAFDIGICRCLFASLLCLLQQGTYCVQYLETFMTDFPLFAFHYYGVIQQHDSGSRTVTAHRQGVLSSPVYFGSRWGGLPRAILPLNDSALWWGCDVVFAVLSQTDLVYQRTMDDTSVCVVV